MNDKERILIGISIFIAALFMLIYVLRVSSDNSFKYNGFTVYKTDTGAYITEIYFENDKSPHYLTTRYNPKDLEYIDIEKDIKRKVLRDEIFITLNPNLSAKSLIALAEISKVTGNQFLFNTPTKGALTEPKAGNEVKTCDDVVIETSVIWLKLGHKNSVYSWNECVIVEGVTEDDIIKAGTALTLNMLGIMD
jgi:hypothetical protein